MVNLFDRIYSSIVSKNAFLNRIRFYSILRFSTRFMANAILPICFILTKNNSHYKLSRNNKTKNRIIVSFTSFPTRINRVWLVVETMLRQTIKPDMIILWLSKDQFPSIESIPKKLLQQGNRGLDIRLVDEDLRSHKKYYYTLMEYPNDIMITIDDDIFYPDFVIEKLINYHKLFPNYICCNRALLINYEKDKLLPYMNWENLKNDNKCNNLFFTSGGSTLFPPNSLYQDVVNKDIFIKYCFKADDVWLNVMTYLNETNIIKTDYYSACLPIINRNNKTLSSENLNGLNDIQINAVREYCINNLGKDPFYKGENI